MRLTLLENDEKNTPVRAKRTSDLDMFTFQGRWSCRQNGKALENKNKSGLFKQLQQQQPKLFTYVQSGATQSYVIAKENIQAFKQALQNKGYEVKAPEARTANVSRAKLPSDLDKATFQGRWSCRQNGKTLARENKSDLFKQLQQQQPELFTYVKAGSNQSYVIARENIPAFKQALQNKGYEVTDPEERTANISRAKRASDLDKATFQGRWSCRQNGKALGVKNKSDLFKQLQQQQPELFTYVQSGVSQSHVIARENIPAFKQALQNKGYEVTDMEARTANVSRAKLPSDLDMNTFQRRWSCQKDGKAVYGKNKNDLFKQLQQQQPELFTYVHAGSKQPYVIARENIYAFKQALAEKGYETMSPWDKLHEAQEKATAAHTPAEKQKYLAAARQIFRALNPQLEKQNLCAACQQKISAGR